MFVFSIYEWKFQNEEMNYEKLYTYQLREKDFGVELVAPSCGVARPRNTHLLTKLLISWSINTSKIEIEQPLHCYFLLFIGEASGCHTFSLGRAAGLFSQLTLMLFE